MKRPVWHDFAVAAVALSVAGCEQEAAPPQLCWEIATPAKDAAPYLPIMVDRCTGKTWVLVRTRFTDSTETPAPFTWRWHPITVNEHSEAILR